MGIRYAQGLIGRQTTVTVVTTDGRRHHDAIVHHDPSHPFGVVAIEAFEDVKKFPGLRLNTARPQGGHGRARRRRGR